MSVSSRAVSARPQPIRLAYLNRASAPCKRILPDVARSPRSSDEFWLLARWDRTPRSLAFHTESLISWAPIEILGRPQPVEDETGTQWMLCRFRYFGPYADRDRLIESARKSLDRMARWEEVSGLAFD